MFLLSVVVVIYMHTYNTSLINFTDLQIINGPRGTTLFVCINDKVDINCGFQGANPTEVEVIWYIARQNSRVMTVPANDILTPTNGLQCMGIRCVQWK